MNKKIAIGLSVALIAGAGMVISPVLGEPERPPQQPENPSRYVLSDFTLSDQTAASHHFYDLKDRDAVVLIWQGVGCPIVQQMSPAIKEMNAHYSSRNVAVLMINSNMQDTPAMIRAEAEQFELGLPVLKDQTQKIARAIGVRRTAEVIIAEPKKRVADCLPWPAR